MSHFEKLNVWCKAHEVTLHVYKVTAGFPKHELFGLSSQMRRSSASIGSNIAEGLGRRSDKELVRFLRIASGSCSELEYQLKLAHDLGYLRVEQYDELRRSVDEVGRMLTGFSDRVMVRIRDTEKPIGSSYLAPRT
jgi:four helix bundle protein